MKTLKCTAEVGMEICKALGVPDARVKALDLNMIAGEPIMLTIRLVVPAECLAELGEVLLKHGRAS